MSRLSLFNPITLRVRDLQARLQTLADRDRRALLVGAVLVVAILLVAALSALAEGVRATRDRIAQKTTLLAELPARLSAAQRVQRLGGDVSLPVVDLAQRLVEKAGLTAVIESTGDGGVRLRLESVPFDNTLDLLADLEAARVATRSIRIDAVSPGRVNVQLDLAPRGS